VASLTRRRPPGSPGPFFFDGPGATMMAGSGPTREGAVTWVVTRSRRRLGLVPLKKSPPSGRTGTRPLPLAPAGPGANARAGTCPGPGALQPHARAATGTGPHVQVAIMIEATGSY
jgi:hypothetical protein